MSAHQYVNHLWDDAAAATLDPVGRLVYRSNLLGSDQRITNTGGGNTSAKIMETDPLSGEPVEVLWVKGSGGDLRTSKRENFSSLYQDKLLGLQKLYAARTDKGLKAPAEDDMVGMYAHTHVQPQPARQQHRHAAAQFSARQARRSHAPERGHRHRRQPALRGADARNLRRRDGVRAVDAARVRVGAGDAGDRARTPGTSRRS